MRSLEALVAELAAAPPAARIELREPILAHGAAAIAPLAGLAAENPDLGPAVTAWLEVLANRDEASRKPAISALRVLVGSPAAETRRHATAALGRLGVAVGSARERRAVVPST